jgi:hypothetical protein
MSYRGYIKNGVAVLDSPANLPDGTPVRIEVETAKSDFWLNKDLQALANDQAAKPIQSLDELAGDWPEDDSIDELIALVCKVRS